MGKTVTINISDDRLVMELKDKIFEKEGVLPQHQRLLVRGKELMNDKLLKMYDLKSEMQVYLRLRVKGGYFSSINGVIQPKEIEVRQERWQQRSVSMWRKKKMKKLVTKIIKICIIAIIVCIIIIALLETQNKCNVSEEIDERHEFMEYHRNVLKELNRSK